MSEIIVSHYDRVEPAIIDDIRNTIGSEAGTEVRQQPKFVASVEWLLATAVFVYYTKPYFEEFSKEAAKDHYQILKRTMALENSTASELSRIDVCAAIGAVSAKFWIRESLSLVAPQADLDVDRWVDHARKGVELATLGLMAPEISKFEVKGALIDPYGHEVIPAQKICRHHQLHHYGFS